MAESAKFTGTGVAIITPFQNDGSIDFKQLERNVDHLINEGIEYLVALGTTAETPTLDNSEKLEIITCVKKANSKRVPLVIGAGGNNTAESVNAIKEIGSNDVDGYLSVVPYYNKPSQTGIKEHFSAVAAASDLPLILYNIPGRTGTNMTADTTLEIAHDLGEKVAAVKEASGDLAQMMKVIAEKPAEFLVLSGDDALALPLISIGGKGVISVIGNALPGQFSEMVRTALDGDFANAKEMHYRMLPLMELLFREGNPTGVKTLMEIQGKGECNLRLPLIQATSALSQAIEKASQEL